MSNNEAYCCYDFKEARERKLIVRSEDSYYVERDDEAEDVSYSRRIDYCPFCGRLLWII